MAHRLRDLHPSVLSTRKENYGSEGHSRRSKTVWDNTLSHNNKFNDIHSIDAMIGRVVRGTLHLKTQSLSGRAYPDDEIFTNIGSAAALSNWSSGYSSTGLFSSFARANYRLFDRYLFTFTCRYDGSSMFRPTTATFFPSGSHSLAHQQ